MLVLEINDIKILLKRLGFRRFFTELISALEEDYASWEGFDKMPRPASHVLDGVIELMPICNDTLYSFKYVNGHPKNPKNNKPTVMATGQLSLVSSGEPLMFSEMTLLTALRTAATSALAAHYLLSKEPKSLAFIGTGAQSEFQYLAFSTVFDIKELRYFDVDKKAMQKFENNIAAMNKKDMKLVACKNTKEAVMGADMITTMTADKANRTILTPDMLSKDVFINGIGGDCPGKTELHQSIVENALVVVEYLEQSKVEGEIQQLSQYDNCIELHEIIRKKVSFNVATHGTIIFDSVGFALEDYSVLRYVYALAQKLGVGKEMELIPQTKDVKNLYAIIKE